MRLQGTYTALVTPFRDGAVDEDALKNLVDFQLRGGIDGIVPCGTTGEASTLSYEEHERVIALTVKWVGGKVPIIPGTGSNSTKETIELTEIAKTWPSSWRPITTALRRKACTATSGRWRRTWTCPSSSTTFREERA
jgi:4-hydroxy-tetrahydrodipicolinate synthase